MHLLPEFGFLQRRLRTIVYWLTVLLNCWIHLGLFAIDGVEGLTLAPVYWNASNPMFKPSINNPVIEVQLRDEIDFVCPWDASNGTDGSSSTSSEYYAIYQVSKTEYDSCNLFTGERNPLLIVNCSAPDAKRRFTVIFEPYQSIPNVPEYKLGMTYYYTTTSTGKRDGISNLNNGACHDSNMKLAFYVCCPTTTTPGSSSTNLTSTTASQPSTVRISQSSLTSTSNKINKPTDSISQLLSPSSSSTTTSITRRPRTSTSTSTMKSTSSPTPKSDASTTSTSVKRIGDISTTKITQLPQPSYQQTISGCRQTFLSPTVTILTLTLGRFLYHSTS